MQEPPTATVFDGAGILLRGVRLSVLQATPTPGQNGTIQVRFCRYRFSATDELKHRGARRVRTQCPLYKRPLLFIIRFNC